MFNIFEGNADAKALKLQERLELLKRARENYMWVTNERVPIPEIVADGHGPDDTSRPSPFVKHEDVAAPPELDDRYCPHAVSKELSCVQCGRGPSPAPPRKYYTSQPCNLCNGYTRHVSHGRGTPVWHCTVCCTCDFCMEEAEQRGFRPRPIRGLSEQAVSLESAHEQIEQGREALHDALKAPADQLFFCTKCGAGLRCGTCNNTGTGRYCDLCGRKDTGEGFCTDCWQEEDTDG